MKELRKDNENFVCEECNKKYNRFDELSKHIIKMHNGSKQYYNKWIKEEKDECICRICKEEAKFRSLKHGYNYVCEKKECLYEFKHQNLEKGMIKKYGTHASVYVKEIKDKQEITCIKKYGSSNPLSSKKIQKQIKETNIKKYGCENPMGNKKIRENAKNTNFIKFGYYNAAQSSEIQDKIQKTMFKKYGVKSFLECRDKIKKGMFEKYGVEYPIQNKEISF